MESCKIMCFHKFNHGTLETNNTDLLHKLNDDAVTLSDYCKYTEFDECCGATGLKIMHHNVRSLVKNLDEVKEIAVIKTPHIMLFCETFLHNNNVNKCNIPGYEFFYRNRESGKGGGVAIYVKEELKPSSYDMINKPLNTNIESLSVKCNMPKGDLIVCECYRKPNTPEQEFIDYMSSISNELNNAKCNFVIGTDPKYQFTKC